MSHSAVSIRSPCAVGNELASEIEIEIESIMRPNTSFYVIFYYEYHYSPHKLAFQNLMRAGDQKLMIDLEWPNQIQVLFIEKHIRISARAQSRPKKKTAQSHQTFSPLFEMLSGDKTKRMVPYCIKILIISLLIESTDSI